LGSTPASAYIRGRLEAQVWLNQLLDQLPEGELAAPADQWRNLTLRGPSVIMLAKA
jgi:hypothetical protein